MYRYFLIGFLLSVVCLAVSCGSDGKMQYNIVNQSYNDSVIYDDFVYVAKTGKFGLNDSSYFPIMLNYVVNFRTIDGKFVVSPAKYYEQIGVYESNTKEEIANQMNAHFELIKEMGFNTIRVCLDRYGKDGSGRFVISTEGKDYYLDESKEDILQGFSEMVEIAKNNGLHVMLLLKPPFDKQIRDFTIGILSYFSDNPAVFAYDFMNEPLYFDSVPQRDKIEAMRIVSYWKGLRDRYAPKQLFTIGFSEPIEVFEWDASIMPVDFVQIHTYHPLRVKSEIYWYAKYIGKPWMIGETALPADDDSITYDDQRKFMKEAYEYVRDCGGAGFGWWEFQECPNTHFEAQYTGLLNHEGYTETASGKRIVGTLKPAVKEIAEFSKYEPRKVERPINYFNMIGYNNIQIKGRIVDEESGIPVEGALVRGWAENWIGMNTYTDENGVFTLYCNAPAVHFEISACGMSNAKFDRELTYTNVSEQNYDLNDLPNKNLEYHKISYHPFLNDNANGVFDFDAEKFSQYKFVSDMGDIYLVKLIQ